MIDVSLNNIRLSIKPLNNVIIKHMWPFIQFVVEVSDSYVIQHKALNIKCSGSNKCMRQTS